MLENIGVMRGIGGKMDWLNQRQVILSGNIANADTPGYRPYDIEEVDFSKIMGRSSQTANINPVTTKSNHMGPAKPGEADTHKSKDVYEAAPAENSVILEEQLIKAQKTQSDYALITNLYKKNVGMINIAIGK